MHQPFTFREAVESVPLGADVTWTYSREWLWALEGYVFGIAFWLRGTRCL